MDKAKKKEEVKSSSKDDKGKEVRGGSDPLEPPSPSSATSSSSSSSSSSLSNSSKKKHSVKTPLLKLDVKFDLPIYSGELDVEKLDNWLKQIEVYCRVQNILDDSSKIYLATLRMGGNAQVWGETKIPDDLATHGKIISSWYEFTSALKKQFYPLGYMQQAIMDWKNLRQGKG